MTALDAAVVEHGCAVLIAFCFWGSFRLNRATRGRLATTRHAPMILVIGGALSTAASYLHVATGLYVASFVFSLMGQNHSRTAFANALGAETYEKRARELVHVTGASAYLRAVALANVSWVIFGAVLLVASRGKADPLYWVANGLLAAQVVGFLSTLRFVRAARRRDDSATSSIAE